MDNLKIYTEKLEDFKRKYQAAVIEGNTSRINQLIRDATFVCSKLFKNVIVEFSNIQEVAPFTKIIEKIEVPFSIMPLISNDTVEKIEVPFSIMPLISNDTVENIEKSVCENCSEESEKKFCCQKCRGKFNTKSYLLRRKEKRLLTV